MKIIKMSCFAALFTSYFSCGKAGNLIAFQALTSEDPANK